MKEKVRNSSHVNSHRQTDAKRPEGVGGGKRKFFHHKRRFDKRPKADGDVFKFAPKTAVVKPQEEKKQPPRHADHNRRFASQVRTEGNRRFAEPRHGTQVRTEGDRRFAPQVRTESQIRTDGGRRLAEPRQGDRGKRFLPQIKQVMQSFRGDKSSKLRIIPLGGMEEVGRNMTIFEYGKDIIILDMGLQFPEEDMPGIDYIIPNVDYLKGKEKNVKAVIFSHAHMDHIGAAPILLERLGYPLVVGRPMTLAFLKHRQEDYKPRSVDNLKTMEIKGLRDVFRFGEFRIKFFQVEHSIMDAVGTIIETPVATVLHLGDWTLEKDEHGRPTLDYGFLSKLKRPIVLMSESLGVVDVRPSATSSTMKQNLAKIISDAHGRVIIGTFASQIERVGWIIEVAERLGKKVALDGYSMKMNIEIAKNLGYIKTRKGTLIKIDEIHDYPENELVIIVTGAQGETNAVFYRAVTGAHQHLKIKKNDTVVFSSSIIPGNERSIQKLKDTIYRQSANVIHGEIMNIHVSGHANREDNIRVLKQIKPDYYIPVYAYHYMLVEAAKLAKEIGFKEKNIFVMDNGQVAEFSRGGARLSDEKVSSDYVMVDGLGVSDSHDVVLRDRMQLAEDGMFVVIVTIDFKTGELLGNPDIISRGFVYLKENKDLVEKTRTRVKHLLKDSDPRSPTFEDFIKNKIRNDIGQFLFTKTQKRPMILPVLIEV